MNVTKYPYRKLSFWLTTILILFLNYSIQAQQGTLKGVVKDKSSENPLEFVTVSIHDLKKGAYTDSVGRFSIERIPYGTYELKVSYVSHQEQKRLITIDKPSTSLEVLLAESSESLEEVKVFGISEEVQRAKEVKQKVMPVTVITSKEFENRASNLNELLTRQAGVQIRRSGGFGSTATISVRGLEGKRVQVFIDGNPVNTPDGSFGINDIPLQLIERVEIYKGTIPAYLGGDGLGSAVNVVTKHRNYSYIDANIARQSFNTTNTGLIVKKAFDKAGIEAGVGIFDNRSDNDYIMQSPYQENMDIKRDHDKFHNLLIGASVRFHKLWFDEVEVEFAHNDVYKEHQGIQRNIQHVTSTAQTMVIASKLEKADLLNDKLDLKINLLKLNINSTFTDTSVYAYNWDGTRVASLIGRGELGIGPNLSETKQDEFRARANFNYQVSPSLSLNLNHNFRTSYFNPKDDLGNEYASRNVYNYDGYLESSVLGFTGEIETLNKRLLLSGAIKHYYSLVTGYNTNLYIQGDPDEVSYTTNKLGYNMGMRYNFTKTLFLKASHELAIRLPLSSELFGDGALITPSIYLKPEEAYNYSIGMVYDRYQEQDRRLQLESNVFYLEVDHLIQLAGSGLTTGYTNYAQAQIVGMDMDWKFDLSKHFYVSCNATYQSVKDVNKYIPGTNNVENPTYDKEIPNIPKLFSNWSLEYHADNIVGKDSRTRLTYEGGYVHAYNYGFELSRNDNFKIPTSLTHNIILEHSLRNQRWTITGEVQNLTNAVVINNWNQPLAGRIFRIKLRYLLLDE
ncbi:TonB-dependent receptor [Limibacter armeniacum]|uniref:TonB-dependent receptor n=1 Tax=Limibacter armeniacum TaxID=466084 RepID=UPI002FE52755